MYEARSLAAMGVASSLYVSLLKAPMPDTEGHNVSAMCLLLGIRCCLCCHRCRVVVFVFTVAVAVVVIVALCCCGVHVAHVGDCDIDNPHTELLLRV